MSKHTKIEIYPLGKSPLRRLGRRRDLAALLEMTLPDLEGLIAKREEYYFRKSEEINGKRREIACPFGSMRRVHERLASLLNRVEQPQWLSSPRRKMTVVKSAAKHGHSKRYVSLDVKKFYPSTTDEHIFQLFFHVFEMREDVAGMLTKLVTIDGRAPFGSPLSPILCAITHRDVFDEINELCMRDNVVLTVWVDDVTVSGNQIKSSLLFGIKRAIRRKGLHYHKVHRRSAKRGMVMTGVFVSMRGLTPSRKSHLKMRDGLASLYASVDPVEQLAVVRSLIGQNVFMAHVYEPGDVRRQRLIRQRQWLHTYRRKLERAIDNAECSVAQTGDFDIEAHHTSHDDLPF